METNINIAKILKNVPIGTKLYSPLFGDVFLKYIGEIFITVRHHGKTANFYHNMREQNQCYSLQKKCVIGLSLLGKRAMYCLAELTTSVSSRSGQIKSTLS